MRRKSGSTVEIALWTVSAVAVASCAVLGWQVMPVETAAFALAALIVIGLRALQAHWERVGDPLQGQPEQSGGLFRQPVLLPVRTKPERPRGRRAPR